MKWIKTEELIPNFSFHFYMENVMIFIKVQFVKKMLDSFISDIIYMKGILPFIFSPLY